MRTRPTLLLTCLAVCFAGPVLAQGAAGSTGVVEGHVSDVTGAVVPGVAVTLTGTTLLEPRAVTTDQAGLYRFPGVPAGSFDLTFDLPGFARVLHRDLEVGIGVAVTADTVLRPSGRAEVVTVQGRARFIDVTTTRVQANFDRRSLEALPNTRDLWSVLAATPGLTLNRFDVGGSTSGTQTTYLAYGNGGQNRTLIEGMNVTETNTTSGVYFDYGSLDQVIVGTAGNSAEMPTGGVLTNLIGRSGGNRWSGELYDEYENRHLQSRNVSADQISRGFASFPPAAVQQLGLSSRAANTLLDYKNANASIGGPLLKDKLWMWAGGFRQQNVVYQPPAGAILDGTEFLTRLEGPTGKVTWQPTGKNRVVAYAQRSSKLQPFRTDAAVTANPQHASVASTIDQHLPAWVSKVEYDRALGSRGYFELRAGQFGYHWTLLGNDLETPRREDLSTFAVSGGGRDWSLDRRRKQVHGALALQAGHFLGGIHELQFGGEIQDETARVVWRQVYADNVLQVFNNGVASFVRLGLPVDSVSGLRNDGLFVTDKYRYGRLTADIGMRYDRYRSYLPAQSRPVSRFAPEPATFPAVDEVVTFNHLAPRFGLTLDVSGKGVTLLKASVGRYWFNPGALLADLVNPNAQTQYTQYAWKDLDGDRLWEPGESGALQAKVGSGASVAIDPNLRNSHTEELAAWLERELPGEVTGRVGFVWKMDRDGYQQSNANRPLSAWNVPVSVTDPGADGLTGTADDTTVAAFALDPVAAARPVVNVVSNPGGYQADYRSIEVAVNRRFRGRWSAAGSFMLTWSEEYASSFLGVGSAGNYGAGGSLFGGYAALGNPGLVATGATGYPITPNGLVDPSSFAVWSFKLNGSYEPGRGLQLTPVLRVQQGHPYGRVFSASVGGVTQSFAAEPITAHRLDTVYQLDLRAAKRLALRGRLRLGVALDVLNVFNGNAELSVRATTGRLSVTETGQNIPAFGTPLTVLPPRIARVSARVEW